MLLGQLTAISTASNLFYMAVLLSPVAQHSKESEAPRVGAPYQLYLPAAVSLSTIAMLPYTLHTSFFSNLLAMHALLLIPFIVPNHRYDHKLPQIDPLVYYSLVAFATMLIRLRSTRVPFHHDFNRGNPPQYLSWRAITYLHWETLYSHPAQSYIGWDAVWTTVSYLLWEATKSGDKKWTIGLPCVLTTLWSVGFAAPAIFALYT